MKLLSAIAAALAAASLQAADPGFEVKVLDAHGRPVPGATVECRSSRGAAHSVTDDTGLVRIDCAPQARIQVGAPGFEFEGRAVEQPPGLLVFRLRPATLRTKVDVVVREIPEIGPAAGTSVEIERSGARTVFDAVEKLVSGAYVTRRGVMGYGIGPNGTGVVSIRGFGGQPNTGVLVVVDGRPDFQGIFGHPVPDFYSLSDAGTVTVVEGPASVLYGSNAMAGAIEIKPAPPPEHMETRISSSLGSYLTGQHRLSNGAKFGRGFYSFAGGLSHTRGERTGAAFRSRDGSASLGYDLSPVWKTSVQGRFGHFHVEDPGPLHPPLAGSFAQVGRGGGSFGLDNAALRTWGRLSVHSSAGHHIISDGFRSVDRSTGFRLHQHVALRDGLVAEAGAEAANYGGRARQVRSGIDYGSHTLTTAAGFTRVNWAANHRVRLHSGMRYEGNSPLGSIVAPEAGVSYSPADNYVLAASAGRGFRNPTIRELYLFPAPNPALKREHVWNYEASFRARPHSALDASVTLYYADIRDLIVTTGRFPNLRLLNGGRALNRGVETSARLSPARRMRLSAGFARLWSTNIGPHIPRTKLNCSLEIDLKRAFVSLGGMAVGRTWADAQRTRDLGGYHVATLKLTAPVRKRYTVFAAVDNLFHKAYQVIEGYPMPGANFAGGFTLTF